MGSLGKRGDLAARRPATSYLMTDEAVVKLFDTVGPRFGDRNGGYTRIIRTGWNKGDGADKAFLELLGSEKVLDEKREKRAEARTKKVAEAKKAMEEAETQAQAQGEAAPAEGEEKKEWFFPVDLRGTARAVPSCCSVEKNYCPRGPVTVPMNPVLLSRMARRSWLPPCGTSKSIGTIIPLSKIC